MVRKYFLIGCLILIGLTACADEKDRPHPTEVLVAQTTNTAVPPSPTPPPTNTTTPSLTPTTEPSPTPQPTGTATPTPTPSPTLSISVYAQTPVPPPQQQIEPDNVKQVTELAQWGRGVINDLAISEDGRWLAVGTATGVYIHDAQDLSVTIHHIETDTDVDFVAISPDGTIVVLYQSPGLLQVWDAIENRIEMEQEIKIMDLEFSSSGEYFLVHGGDDQGVRIFETASGEVLQSFPGSPWGRFSPDNDEIIIWSYVLLSRYTWPENVLIEEIKPYEPGSIIVNAQYYSDNGFLVTSQLHNANGPTDIVNIQEGPGGAFLFELDSVSSLSTPRLDACNQPIVLADPPADPEPWGLDISADGSIVAVVYFDRGFSGAIKSYNEIKFYHRESRRLLYSFEESVADIVMVPETNTWIAGLEDGRLQVHSIFDGSLISSIDNYDSPALHSDISPDNQIVAVEYHDDVKLFSAANGDLINQFSARRAAFSLTNEYIALGFKNGRIEIRSLLDNQLIRTINAHTDAITALVYLSSGELISTGLDCQTFLLNPENGVRVRQFENHLVDTRVQGEQRPAIIWNLSVIQDEFLVGQFNFEFGVWDIVSGELRSVNEAYNFYSDDHASFENNLAFASSPMRVGNVDEEGQFIELWEGASIEAVGFSPDGRMIVTGSDNKYVDISLNGQLNFWLTENGELINVVYPVTDRVTSITFSPNGRFFVSTTLDGITRLWGIPF